jgi:pSer/pThr/pTyr-binding forkhead associated (FHA) protein
MRAMLVLQEGPGAGHSYPLDPSKQTTFSVGRSTGCDIVLSDHRSSRHHADIRWSGRYWEVVDQESTNGTYVNGLQVHQPYDLRPGDRVTIGETTMVLQPAPSPSPRHAHPGPARPRLAVEPDYRQQASTGTSVAFWLVTGVVLVAIVCLATGAFLPWLRLTGSLSQDLEPLIKGVTDIISSIFGEDSLFHVTQEVNGLDGYGKLTLGIAAICTVALVVDLFFHRKSVVPAVVYLLSGMIAVGAMASDLVNVWGLYKQVESWSVMFGIELGQVVEFFDQFIKMEVEPLIGLQLTVVGLVLLLVGGIGRLLVALLARSQA